MAQVMKDQLTQELEKETTELKQQLMQRQQEAASNQAASQILSQFINDGQAEMDDRGQVRLTPNKIKNVDSVDSLM